MEESKERIRSRLIEMREAAGLTGGQLVDAINSKLNLKGTKEEFSLNTYRKYESGTNTPQAAKLVVLARFYECSVNSILGIPDVTGVNRESASDYTGLSLAAVENIRGLPDEWRDILDALLLDLASDESFGSLYHILEGLSTAKTETARRGRIIQQANDTAAEHARAKAESVYPEDMTADQAHISNMRFYDMMTCEKELKNISISLQLNELRIRNARDRARRGFDSFAEKTVPPFNDRRDLSAAAMALLPMV